MLQQFKIRKEQSLKLARETMEDVKLGREALEESGLLESMSKLEEETFRIALVAPFSAGKSTFINGLIGTDLLSMDVRAETATITTLKYAENPRIEIHYMDGHVEVLPSEGETLAPEELRMLLKRKTAVNRGEDGEEIIERVEDTIQNVDVYWNLPLCKGGVEIVDTPGLFARHEEHEAITQRILPTVNAVLFLIEPDSVGEKHFQEVINQRVEDAKNSNLEKDGRHIFFILNKIDQFSPKQLEDAKSDLLEVLQPLLPHPQIYEVSSYFALVSRMYFQNEIELSTLQRDQNIRYRDEEGFLISGRQLGAEQIQTIFELSRFSEVEAALAEYLEQKNNFLIEDVIQCIQGIYERQISDRMEEIQLVENVLKQDREIYIQRLEELKKFIGDLNAELSKNVERTIREELIGGTAGGGGLEAVTREVRDTFVPRLIDELSYDIGRFWDGRKGYLTEHNAKTIVGEVADRMNDRIAVAKKQLIKSSFDAISGKIAQTGMKLGNYFEYFENAVQQGYQQKLDLKDNQLDTNSFFNVELLIKQLEKNLENEFSRTLVSLSDKLKKDIDKTASRHVDYVDKPGLWNWIKSWVGAQEQERVFDDSAFRRDITEMVRKLTNEAAEEFRKEANLIAKTVSDNLRKVINAFQQKVQERIQSYQAWRTRMIESMNHELLGKETSLEQVMEGNRRRIKECEDKLAAIASQMESLEAEEEVLEHAV
ncbi:dynamin family protein [Paenibacillus thailandensis]|uniref:Dynamin family protein n=1 Tax=Paenibacillus thailandensis TaxID=393250 RepID=A0ABW5R0X2_9BACL